MNWKDRIEDYVNDILDKTCDLLMIPSVLDEFNPDNVCPFGEEINNSLHFMLDLAKKDGFTVKNIDNYAGHIEYGEGDEIVGILCHLDVVPVGDGWNYDPFSATIEDNKIFARGALDDKGPTMAAYYALKMIKDSNVKLNKKVRIILGTDEETGWRGITRYFKEEAMPDIGFAPDANFPLIYAEKGIFSFEITGDTTDSDLVRFTSGERGNVVPNKAVCVLKGDYKNEFEKYLKFNDFTGNVSDNKYTIYGKGAHAMQPQLGVNAAFILVDFLKTVIEDPFVDYIYRYLNFDAYGEKLNIDFYDEEMKNVTINPGVFTYDESGFRILVNCRYPKGWVVSEQSEKIIDTLTEFGYQYNALSDSPVHYVSKDDELVTILHDAYKKYTGDHETPLLTIGGGTYARAMKKAVAFGPHMPGKKDTVHQANEYIEIDELLIAVQIYAESIYHLAK